MPRRPRINLEGVPQHVIQRGNNRLACFFTQQDYEVYLSKLNEYAIQHEVNIHGFVLMTNHVHLLMTPTTKSGISLLMQSVGRYYVRYINRTYNRTGTLWEGRFKSTLVDSERYFLVVSRYIELNPVRAAMVDHPARYPWSSYRANALGKQTNLLRPHPCYLALGSTAVERRTVYQALFEDQIPDLALKEIRDSINKSWALGDEKFIKQIENQTGLICGPVPRGGDRRSNGFLERSS